MENYQIRIRPDGGGIVYRGDLPSWWRQAEHIRGWLVHSCFWGMAAAVTDDFGNLVLVPS